MFLLILGLVLAAQVWAWIGLSRRAQFGALSRIGASVQYLGWALVPLGAVIAGFGGAIGLEHLREHGARESVDRGSGDVVKFASYENNNAGQKLRSWARWVHTGEAFGIPGQTVAGVASAGVLLLAYTGFALSWRRFTAWITSRRKVPGTNSASDGGRTQRRA